MQVALFFDSDDTTFMFQAKSVQFSTMGAKHSTNDDFALMNQEQGIYVICDGVSEGGKGRFASEFVAKQIQEKLVEAGRYLKNYKEALPGPKKLQRMQEFLVDAYSTAQKNLMTLSEQNSNYKNSHSTCITVWVDGQFAILGHLGDSRAYLYRAGKIYTLTKDHKGYDELIKMGKSPEEAAAYPMANALSRAFGSNFSVPDLLLIEFQPKDILFLATDGLYSPLSTGQGLPQLVEMMLTGKDLKPAVEQCARLSGDDATLIEVQFPDSGSESPLHAADRVQLVSEMPASRYFDYAQKSHMAALCQIEEYKAGSVIVQEGTEGETLYIVARGTLEILIKGQFIAYKKPGEFIGEVTLIQQGKRTATAVAKEDVVLLSLKRQDLYDSFKNDIEFERNFYKGILDLVLDRLILQGREIAKMKSV
jgi:serine/threonine protein phosphatase PrpC